MDWIHAKAGSSFATQPDTRSVTRICGHARRLKEKFMNLLLYMFLSRCGAFFEDQPLSELYGLLADIELMCLTGLLTWN